ncbi:MAG TPA: TonB-dependent receptor, partial [bacterium]|nr:TonB-dependent receptor [bacterium]
LLFWLTAALLLPGAILAHTGRISGRVIDARSREPIPGANVMIQGTVLGVNSDAEGRFSINSLAPGNYELRVSAVGYLVFNRRGIALTADQTVTLDVTLEPTLIESGEVVVSASKRRQSLEDSPTSVGVMTTRELAQKNQVYLDRVLEHASGVNFIGSQINIRGSSGYNYGAGSRVLMLIDGVPVMPGDSGDIKWSMVPASQVDHVEIVKGAGSALYGSSALGGVVNVITKEASANPVTHVRFSAGFYDKPLYAEWRWTDRLLHFDDLDVDHSRRIGKSNVMVALGRHQSTGYAQNGWYQRLNGLFKWQRQLTPKANLTLSSNFETNDNGTGLMWRSQSEALSVAPEAIGDKVKSDKFGFNLFHRWAASSRFALNTRLSYFRNFWKNYFHDNLNASQANRIGLEIQGDYQFSNINALTFGTEESWDIVESGLVGDHTQYVISGYIQNERRLLAGLALTLGARYDLQRVDTGFQDENLSPKVGLVWHARPWLSLRGSSGSGFRAASMSERFSNSVYSGLQLIPNPDLKSETAWSHEAGATLILLPMLSLDISSFRSDYWDLIEPEPTVTQEIQFTNVTRARISGIETGLRLQPGIPGLSLQSAYTWMDPRDLELDQTLAYRPRQISQTTLLYTAGPFEISADYRYISRLDNVKLYPSEDRVAQKTLDLHLTWHYRDWSLSGHINNARNHNHTQMERTLQPIRSYMLTLSGTI